MQPNVELISKAMSFDMDHIIARYVEDEEVPTTVAEEHERELKRFLALCALNEGPEKYGMRGPVDHLWHTFIMFTKEYHQFCDAVGGRFIHHSPEKKSDAVSEISVAHYEKFLSDYKATFGEVAPVHIWPTVVDGKIEGSDCDGCSGCGT